MEKFVQKKMESEINILPNSPLVKEGVTIGEIKQKFNLNIEHIHNPLIKNGSVKKEIEDNRKIELGMGIHFSGKPEDIFNFLDYALG